MKKKIFSALAFHSFLLMYGSVGGMESGSIAVLPGTILSVVFLVLLALFTYLAGEAAITKIDHEGGKENEIQKNINAGTGKPNC